MNTSKEVRRMRRLGNRGSRVLIVMLAAIVMLLATLPLSNARNDECEGHSVPFKATGKCYAVATSPPPILEIYISGSGQATHMGRVSIWQHHYVNVISMTFYDGTFVWTAANGDAIEGTYYGSLAPTSVGFEIHGYFAIEGGTGRFENAVGGGIASGMQYFDNTADLRLDGTITY
jgi:hypothetical protein